jgi:histone H3/H4
MDIPRAPLERIMRNAGADRVSEDAIEVLKDAAEDVADDIAEDAINKSHEEGRDTVKRVDIRLAAE